jgi:DNA damage-binding protein 1
VVLTDHPDPRLIILKAKQSVKGDLLLTVVKTISLHDRHGRHADFCLDVAIDPTGKIAVASAYAGKLRVVVLDDGVYESDFDAV